MKERIARAIYEANSSGVEFRAASEWSKNRRRKEADAVLDAMREPTEEMIKAGFGQVGDGCVGAWEDMIDEAKK